MNAFTKLGEGEKHVKTIAISGLKGGISKTTAALSLAYVASNEFNKKVIVIDFDSQSSASILLGVTPNNYDKRTPFDDIPAALEKLKEENLDYEIDYLDDYDDNGDLRKDSFELDDGEDELDVNGIHTILDYMVETGRENKCIPSVPEELLRKCIHTPTYTILETKKDKNGKTVKDKNGKIVRERVPYEFGFDIIPSTEYLSDIQLIWNEEYMGPINFKARGMQLKIIIDAIKKFYPDYDYCIIDLPPALDLLFSNAAYAADCALIPVSEDKQSLFSLMRIKRNIKIIKEYANKNNENYIGILGIVLTIFNERRSVDRYISKTVGKDLKLHVFNTRITETNDAKKAVLSGLILPQINERNYKENCELFKEIDERFDKMKQREKIISERKEK